MKYIQSGKKKLTKLFPKLKEIQLEKEEREIIWEISLKAMHRFDLELEEIMEEEEEFQLAYEVIENLK